MASLEGALLKDGGWRKGWRKRYFKLTKIYFQYYENESCTSPKSAMVRGTIQNVELVDLLKCHFRVTFKSETWDLQAYSKEELIKWMEAIKPNSATHLKQLTRTQSPQLNNAARPNFTSFEPTAEEHDYQPLPQGMLGAHQLGAHQRHTLGSDGRSSPATTGSLRNRSASGQSANSTTSSQQEYLDPHPAAAPPPVVNPLPLDLSDDDEFLDFAEDANYMNDPALTLGHSNSSTLTGQQIPPALNIIPQTPESTLPSAYARQLSLADIKKPEYINEAQPQKPEYINDVEPQKPEYMNDETDASPVFHRRSIKSLKNTGNVNYSLSVDRPDSEDESPDPPAQTVVLKSTGPATDSHTLQTRDSTNSFLSVSPTAGMAAAGITTMRVREWIKSVKTVKKEFVDPDDLDELDKYLLDNTPCLPRDNVSLLLKIGNGAFGEVWKGRASPVIDGQEYVAVKTLKSGSTEKTRHDFYGEAALLGQFKHENVIALHGVVLQEESPWIVIEYADHGALKSFLKKQGETRHSNQLLSYCRDIVRGMRYLSERGYVHRDLAARNVLVTRLEVCKIADFGLSRKLGEDEDIYVSRGGMVAIKWTAPEGVIGASYSSASDCWSCGVTMWEVFSVGANPFSGQSNEDAFRYIRKGGRLTRPEKCPEEVYKVILKCWEANPLDRPTFGELDDMLYDPNTDINEQPLYMNSEGFVQYVNMSYENMPDVERD